MERSISLVLNGKVILGLMVLVAAGMWFKAPKHVLESSVLDNHKEMQPHASQVSASTNSFSFPFRPFHHESQAVNAQTPTETKSIEAAAQPLPAESPAPQSAEAAAQNQQPDASAEMMPAQELETFYPMLAQAQGSEHHAQEATFTAPHEQSMREVASEKGVLIANAALIANTAQSGNTLNVNQAFQKQQQQNTQAYSAAAQNTAQNTTVVLSPRDRNLLLTSFEAHFENSIQQTKGQECNYLQNQSCLNMSSLSVHSSQWALDQGVSPSAAQVSLRALNADAEATGLEVSVSFKLQNQNMGESIVEFTAVAHQVVARDETRDETRDEMPSRVFYLQFNNGSAQGQTLRQVQAVLIFNQDGKLSNESKLSFVRNNISVRTGMWSTSTTPIQKGESYYIPSEMTYTLKL